MHIPLSLPKVGVGNIEDAKEERCCPIITITILALPSHYNCSLKENYNSLKRDHYHRLSHFERAQNDDMAVCSSNHNIKVT